MPKLVKALKSQYKPVAPVTTRSVLDQVLCACCLENAPSDIAEKALARLVAGAFDLNEIRVTTVAELATREPATIQVFQGRQIDFCCGGKVPLAEACARKGLDLEAFIADLRAATRERDDVVDWQAASLTDLVTHIQEVGGALSVTHV